VGGLLAARRAPAYTARCPPSDGPFMHEKSNRVIVTVIGEDKVGIIAAVAAVLAEANANIVDISQTTLREFFTMIMMVDLTKATVPFDELKRQLAAKGELLGLKIDAQHEDVFKFMHRV
jgi:ACT domain-containing protein